MCGLQRVRSAQTVNPGHAFVRNIRRGHYELAVDTEPRLRVSTAFIEPTLAI